MQFQVLKDRSLEVKIQDNVFSLCDIFWRFNLHFGPDLNSSKVKINNFESTNLIKKKYVKSWTAFEFGKRVPSKSLLIFGKFKKGKNSNILKFILKP